MIFVRAALIVGIGSLAFAAQVPAAHRQTCLDTQQTDELLAAASSLLQQNRLADAAALLQSKGQGHCTASIDLLLAAAFDGEGDSASAERILQQALVQWPSNTSVATSLARDELRHGDLTAARQAVARCRPTERTPQPELRMIALVYLESHDLPHALEVADLAWHADPSQENLLFAANVLQLEGRYNDVVARLRKYRDQFANSPGFLITIGESESDGKLYQDAERDLKQAVALAPQSYPAHYMLGHLLVARGDLAGGIQEYHEAISLSPQQPRTYCQLGRALEENNDDEQAQRCFKQAISLDPQYEPAYFELGKMELRNHQPEKAAEHLDRAIQINPASQRSYYLLMQAYTRLGDRQKAESVKQQWTAYKQTHPLLPAGTADGSPTSSTQR